MDNGYPFDNAVADYIASLDEERRQILRTTILNSQAEDDWPWFEDVIERYQLRDKNSPVLRDINERVEPDPHGINSLLWAGVGNTEPIFEAMTLLCAVREALKAQSSP